MFHDSSPNSSGLARSHGSGSSSSRASRLNSARSPEGIDKSCTASESISRKKLPQRLDPTLQLVQDRVVLGQLERAIENAEAGIELPPLAFGQDLAKQRPDVGLRSEQLAALSRPMHLVNDPPGQQLSKFMLTLPRETPSQFRRSSAVHSVPVM